MAIRRSVSSWLLMGLFALFSDEAMSMGTMYLFSEVKGVVTHNGQPIVGAVVEQAYRRGDAQGSTETKTDAAGNFHFPTVTKWSLLSFLLPHEPFIEQTILIKHGGVTYKAWLYDKHDYDLNGELNGKPINLHCALENPPKRTEIRSSVNAVFGICEIR